MNGDALLGHVSHTFSSIFLSAHPVRNLGWLCFFLSRTRPGDRPNLERRQRDGLGHGRQLDRRQQAGRWG